MFRQSRIAKIICLSTLFMTGSVMAADSSQNIGSTTSTTTTTTTTPKVETSVVKEKEMPIDMVKLSKAFGNFIGRNLQSPGLKFDLDNLIEGIRDGAAGKPSPLTEKEYETMMAAVQEKAFKEMSETNLKAANEYMEKNSKENNVKVIIPNQLQYSILTEGTGAEVTAHASPKIQYSGKYKDGTVFGSSEEMGGPIVIPLDQTIPGFSKGIVGMKEGEKRRLFVHPDLGYGTTGQLPPNELLIFDIEVVKADASDEKAKDAKNQLNLSDDNNDDDDDDDDDDDFYFEEDDSDETPVPAKAK